MKEIKGYVGFFQLPNNAHEVLLGPKVNKSITFSSENFCTNGMVPFKDSAQARESAAERGEVFDSKNYGAAEIEINIAENDEELEKLRGLTSLIVIEHIVEHGKSVVLRGVLTGGSLRAYPLPGAVLNDNGFVPFYNFEQAEYVQKEVIRQANNSASIASFKFSKIGR